VQRVPYRNKPKRSTPRHIITKMTKIKERILKATRGKKKKTMYRETPIRLSADFFSAETLQARRE